MDHVVDRVVALHEDEEGVVAEGVHSGISRLLFHEEVVVCTEVMEVIQCQALHFQGAVVAVLVVVVVVVMEWCKIHSSLDRGTCQERGIQTTSL